MTTSANSHIAEINAYEITPESDVWQDVILRWTDVDQAATEAADPSAASDIVIFTDGSVIRYERGEWVEG